MREVVKNALVGLLVLGVVMFTLTHSNSSHDSQHSLGSSTIGFTRSPRTRAPRATTEDSVETVARTKKRRSRAIPEGLVPGRRRSTPAPEKEQGDIDAIGVTEVVAEKKQGTDAPVREAEKQNNDPTPEPTTPEPPAEKNSRVLDSRVLVRRYITIPGAFIELAANARRGRGSSSAVEDAQDHRSLPKCPGLERKDPSRIKRKGGKDTPAFLTVYLDEAEADDPDSREVSDLKKLALILVPGGAYKRVAVRKEGYAAASYFAPQFANASTGAASAGGVLTAVFKYTVPPRIPSGGRNEGFAAIALLSACHHELGLVQPNRTSSFEVGLMGFSAGGHLVGHLAATFRQKLNSVSYLQRRFLPRDIRMLIMAYPVVTLQFPLTHNQSREALLNREGAGGKEPWELDQLAVEFSVDVMTKRLLESDPSSSTRKKKMKKNGAGSVAEPQGALFPRSVYIWTTMDDDKVPAANSILMFETLVAGYQLQEQRANEPANSAVSSVVARQAERGKLLVYTNERPPSTPEPVQEGEQHEVGTAATLQREDPSLVDIQLRQYWKGRHASWCYQGGDPYQRWEKEVLAWIQKTMSK